MCSWQVDVLKNRDHSFHMMDLTKSRLNPIYFLSAQGTEAFSQTYSKQSSSYGKEKGKNSRLTGDRVQLRRQLKAYEVNEGSARFEMGVDVNVDRVEMLSKRAIVGTVEFAKLNINELLTWVNKHWLQEVGLFSTRYGSIMKALYY